MRVLQVDKFLHRQGGAAAYMLDLAALQRAAGHDVEFFAMTDVRNEPSRYAPDFAPHVDFEPPPPGLPARIVGAGRLIWNRRAEQAMATVVADFKPDVAHLHNIYHQLTPTILRPLARAGVPVVMTVHDYKLVCPSYRLLDQEGLCTACLDGRFRHAVVRRCAGGSRGASALLALETRVHRTLDSYDTVGAFLCPSEFLLDLLRRADLHTDRLHHVPHFVDLTTVPGRDGTGEGFVFTGRLSREKGVDVLIEAIAQVPDARLTVVGDGQERDALTALADRRAPGQITFTGQLPRAETLSALRAARAFVLPARYYENQPMSVLEAMGSGVTAVVTDLGGCPELVMDGVTGALVPAEDVGALAAVLRDLHANPVRAQRLGAAARQHVTKAFDPGDHLEALNATYAAATAVTRR